MQRSCGSARHRTSAVRTSRPAHVRHRSSKVRPGKPVLVHLRLAVPQQLCRDGARQRCFGRPECGPLGAAGADSVGTSPPQTAPVRPHQRPGQVLLFEGRCQRAKFLSTSLQRPYGARRWAVPAQAREAVCPPHYLSVLVGVWEPKVSQPLHRPSPPEAPTPDHLPGQPSATLRGLGHWQTLRRLPASTASPVTAAAPRPTVPPERLPTTKGDFWAPARRPVRIRASYHARRTDKGFIYIQQGAAAEAAAASLFEHVKKWFSRLDSAGREGVPHVPLY